jgi:hypothetical protein
VAPVDLDDDGWIDLIVANDTVQNFVFHNEKNGTFKEWSGRRPRVWAVWRHARRDGNRFQPISG